MKILVSDFESTSTYFMAKAKLINRIKIIKKMQLENLKDSQSQKWTACDNRFRL